MPGFEGKGWCEWTLIIVLFHEIHSNLMRSPLKYNRFEISNFYQDKTSPNMMKNQPVRNRGGSLLKIIHNIEEGNNMLLKFAYYDAIGSIYVLRSMIMDEKVERYEYLDGSTNKVTINDCIPLC